MPPTPESNSAVESFNDIITKDFLLNAIKQETKSSNVEIISHNVTFGTKPGDNYMSIIYAVDVELKTDKAEAPIKRHLLIKCYPNHPGRQEFTNKSNMFFKELEIYSKWMPELKRFQTEVVGLEPKQALRLPYAKYVHGECIDFESVEGKSKMGNQLNSLDNFIIMEDLKKEGFRMTNRRSSLNFDHMILVMYELAKIHALSWAYRHHVEKNITAKFPCFVPNFDNDDLNMWVQMITGNLNQAKEMYDEEFGPGNEYSAIAEKFKGISNQVMEVFTGTGETTASDFDKLLKVKPDPEKFGKDAQNPEPWKIISHGDCWSNNLLWRYDSATGRPAEVILVDLQVAQETCVVNDLQYVIYACTDGHLRRCYLDTLLQIYHDRFNQCCRLLKTPTLPGFCMDSLKYRFHRAKLLGYQMANIGLPIMLKEEDQVINLEDMDSSRTIDGAFADLSVGMKSNQILKKRLFDVSREMIDDGIL